MPTKIELKEVSPVIQVPKPGDLAKHSHSEGILLVTKCPSVDEVDSCSVEGVLFFPGHAKSSSVVCLLSSNLTICPPGTSVIITQQ